MEITILNRMNIQTIEHRHSMRLHAESITLQIDFVSSQTRQYIELRTLNIMLGVWSHTRKQFDTTEQALAHYKTPAIRAMIQHAADQAAVALA